MNVIKRSGEEVLFDRNKIAIAVTKANESVVQSARLDPLHIQRIAEDVEIWAEQMNRALSVEEIQDKVEYLLMEYRAFVVARSYNTYRYKRALVRKSNSTDEQILSLIEYTNEEVKQENSNKNPAVVSVQRDYMAGEVSKDISKRLLLPEDVVEAHENGIIHYHDMDYFAQHMHNCFHSKTKFYTSNGIKAFKDFNDGDTVQVLDKNGVFREATVRKYGKQKMNVVVFSTAKQEKTVICTENHRWLLSNGEVTTSLKVGDTLLRIKGKEFCLPETYRESEMFALGFLIGDGCDHLYDCGCGGLNQIRLCGEKIQFAPIFKKAGYAVRPIANENNDLMVVQRGSKKQDFLETQAWRFLSLEDKKWLFWGLYKADGSTKANSLSTADERIVQLVKDCSYAAGYYISSENIDVRDTEYKKDSALHCFHFVTNQPNNWVWRVKSIESYHFGTEFDAWCVEEPITKSFVLEGGMITGNCCLVNLEDMLQNGTVISETMIEKPRSFVTACNIASQIVSQVASSQYGGQSITLSHLAPFVQVSREKYRKQVAEELSEEGFSVDEDTVNRIAEKRVKKEIKQGVQTIEYQVITLLTTNGQAPFITVFMYLDEVPEGQTRDDLAAIIEEMLSQRILGVKNEKGVYITPAFPKLIYVLEEDNIHEDSKYWYLTELAAKCTAKRMVPDYISEKMMKQLKIDANGDGQCYPCMGCRSFLTPYVDPETGKPKYYARFNQGVVTINLVDVACSSEGDMDLFWKIFEDRLELCHRALRCRHERLLGTTSDVAPILWQHGALARLKKGEKIDKLLYGGYSTISLGYAGLYECTKYMTGVSHTDPEGKPFALAVMQKLNDKCEEWKNAENIAYSVYGTPLESTTYKFAKCLQKRFGKIKDVTDHNYITNSYHVVVREEIDAFTKLSFESEFQNLSPGGAISYVEVPNLQNNIPAVLSVMQYIYDNIMYAELNTKSDYCQVCGYDGEIQIVEEEGKLVWECPNCHNRDQNKMNVARRTCGYIGTQFWNQGRTQEIKDRVMHL